MSEINSIANGTYTIGQTSATNFVAGPGIKIDEPSAGTVRIGNDETVLWETTTGASACTLSEPMTNFKRIKILYGNGANAGAFKDQYGGYFEADPNFTYFNLMRGKGAQNVWWSWIRFVASDRSNITITATKSFNFGAQTATTWQTPSVSVDNAEDRNCLYKVIGLNRISGSNA